MCPAPEWMEAVKAKELSRAKAKKKSIPKQDDDKFAGSASNKIETAVALRTSIAIT